MSEDGASADKITNVDSFPSTSASTAEFSGVLSPLEPLDPNKFRNIMLDKQEFQVKQEMPIKQEKTSQQRLSIESMSVDSSTSNEFREKSVSLDSTTPTKTFYHQTAPPTPLHAYQQCHSQPPQSPAIQQLQQRSMSLQQHPLGQNQQIVQQQNHLQQYFPAQPPMQQMMHPQQQHSQHSALALSAMHPSTGQYVINPQMVQHPSNYNLMPGHPQQWVHQQQQSRQCLQQQPPPPYQHCISLPPNQQQQQMFQQQQQHPLIRQQFTHQMLQQQQQNCGTYPPIGTIDGSGGSSVPQPQQQQIPPSHFSPHPTSHQLQQHLTASHQQRQPNSTNLSPEYLNYQQQTQQQFKSPPPHYGQQPSQIVNNNNGSSGYSPYPTSGFSVIDARQQQQQRTTTLRSPTENNNIIVQQSSHPNSSQEKIMRPAQMIVAAHAPGGFSSPEYHSNNFNSSNINNNNTNLMYNTPQQHPPLPHRPQQQITSQKQHQQMLQHLQQGMIQNQQIQQPLIQTQQSIAQHQIISTPLNPLNPDICLTGCVFLLIDDCNPQLVDSSLLPSVIRFYGGDIESNNPRGIPERVTHVICSSWLDSEQLIQKALATEYIDRLPRKSKRVVTLHWLNDTLGKGKVEPPSKASHLPGFWSLLQPNPQISSKIISFYGFDQNEANSIKFMIRSVGAYCLPFNSKTNFLVINKSSLTDQIIEKSNLFNSQIVNYKWLFELYFGNISVISPQDAQNYFPESETLLTCVTISPHYLAKMSDFCYKLMLPWTQPILITDEITKSAYLMKRTVLGDVSIFPEKVFRIMDNAPSEDQINKAATIISNSIKNSIKIFVLFDGLHDEQIENLSKKVRFLNGRIAETPNECTHFVTTCLRKSVNLVTCIALGKNIVSPSWIETSFKSLEFIDPLPFFVKDRENERRFCFSLKVSILRARQRKIFKDITFHIAKGTQPCKNILCKLVEAAGGRIVDEKPTKRELIVYIQNNSTFFIVCNHNDLVFYQNLINCNFPIFNEDFILMSILRHKIDLSEEFHAYPSLLIDGKK